MKSKKRGQVSTLVLVIIVVAGAVFLYPSATKLFQLLLGKGENDVCTTSLLLREISKGAGKPGALAQCPIDNAVFHKDYLLVNNKKKATFKNGLNEEQFNEQVANMMYNCWVKTGTGQIDFFETKFYGTPVSVNCLICSQFSIDNDVALSEFRGLDSYIKTTNIPKENTKKTYLDFLYPATSYPKKQASDVAVPVIYFDKTATEWKPLQSFEKQKEYTVVVLATNNPSFAYNAAARILNILTTYTPVKPIYTIAVMPSDSLAQAKACEALLN